METNSQTNSQTHEQHNTIFQTNCSTAVWRVLETWQNKKHLAKCKLMSAARSADIYPFSKQIFSFYSHKSHEIYYACTNITVRSIIIARDVPFYTVILLIIFWPKGGCMKTYSVWKHTVMTVCRMTPGDPRIIFGKIGQSSFIVKFDTTMSDMIRIGQITN